MGLANWLLENLENQTATTFFVVAETIRLGFLKNQLTICVDWESSVQNNGAVAVDRQLKTPKQYPHRKNKIG